MSLKNTQTTTSAMGWPTFLYLIDCLKKDKEYRLLLYVSLSVYLGLRSKDVRFLKWKDIYQKEAITIRERKTQKLRKMHINSNLKEIIQLTTKNKNIELLLNHYIFENKEGEPISIQYWNRCLHQCFSNYSIKVDNPSTHTLRKTFGLRCFQINLKEGKGENALAFLSEIFSHSSQAITRKYLGISQEEIKNVYLSL